VIFPHLFSLCKIGAKTAPNRLVSQAMESNDGEDGGGVSGRAYNRYMNLARGGWGITVVEAISVTPESLARKNGLVMSRKNLDGYKRLADGYKAIYPEGVLLFQITHSGRHSGSFSKNVCLYSDGTDGAHLLSTGEIEDLRRSFVESALLAEEAGADGIDFKLCHGYFGAEMLRPANIRNDRWGGGFENRTRFIRETVGEIRARQRSKGFILGSRISLYEAIRGGCGTAGHDEVIEDLAEMKRVVLLLKEIGMDYINVSAGIPSLTPDVTRPTGPSRFFSLHHFRYARLVKELVPEIPVIGSAYTIFKEDAAARGEENLAKGYADFIGFGRQSFADPLYPKKLASGEKTNYCTACSGCTRLMVAQLNDGCIIYDDYYKELHRTLGRRGAQG
jgi:2,4-dienoyl-CoA reductase-like NADH-dependent reductase (Old Yellow Enzyme family)